MRIRSSFKREDEDIYELRRPNSLRSRIRLYLRRLRYSKRTYVTTTVLALVTLWCLYYVFWRKIPSEPPLINVSDKETEGGGKVDSSESDPTEADPVKRDAVVAAFKHAWAAYERDAMGFDEYHPISKKGENLSKKGAGIGYTVADAIDTMYLMGLNSEYKRARTWIENTLNFDQPGEFSTFETSIRVLGGLLSSYHLTSDRLFLHRAVDLGDRLIKAFDTPSGLPLPSVDFVKRKGVVDGYDPDRISTAEASTLQLEFRYLAELTKNETYWYKAEHVMAILNNVKREDNLVPIYMSARDGTFKHSEIRLGSRGDSYYEYLLKQYLQTAKTESVYRKMYKDSMQGIHDKLVHKTPTKKLTYIAELNPSYSKTTLTLSHKQDHLVCFLAGSLMLGATTTGSMSQSVSIPPQANELSKEGWRDWETGVELLKTCMATHKTATGLSPEIAMFHESEQETGKRDWYIKGWSAGKAAVYDARYMLRPETVESLFIAWRLTGDIQYRKHAWNIFSSIEKHAKLPGGGYATVKDVDTVPVSLDDKQETFYLSETLKYLYLIFCDSSVLPLSEIVFNTEAHPLPVFVPTIKPAFSLNSS